MYIKVNQLNLYVEDINQQGHDTILFIHGWPLSRKIFEYQWDMLAKHNIRCIGVDLIGYGSSDKPWDGYDYDHLSDIIHQIILSMDLFNITLLGFSMGGGIAAKYASKYGSERVKKLILLSAACPCFTQRSDFPYGNTTEAVDKLIQNIKNDKAKTFDDFSNLVFEHSTSLEFLEWFSDIACETPIWSAEKGLEALRNEDLRKDIEAIKIPTAIFHGINDKICPFELAKQMHIRIQNSFILPFEHSGHGIFYQEKDKLNQAILDFTKSKSHPILKRETQKNNHYQFENKPLPYGYASLEPYIDEKTMHLHHDKHLQGYIDNLNKALEHYPRYQTWSLEKLIQNANMLPSEIKLSVEHNAGGVYNHFFYFDSLTPESSQVSDNLNHLICQVFHSFEDFKKVFKEKALSVFGSGYVWLVLNKQHEIEIITTNNQDTPLTKYAYPLLNIDVWEHAYYLKYHNLRSNYIDAWFKVVNWNYVEDRLNQFIQTPNQVY